VLFDEGKIFKSAEENGRTLVLFKGKNLNSIKDMTATLQIILFKFIYLNRRFGQLKLPLSRLQTNYILFSFS
jgi:hypothetical protein